MKLEKLTRVANKDKKVLIAELDKIESFMKLIVDTELTIVPPVNKEQLKLIKINSIDQLHPMPGPQLERNIFGEIVRFISSKFSNKEAQNYFDKAVAKWGFDSQMNIAVEEFAELIVALNHTRRGRITTDNSEKVLEEVIDSLMMSIELLYLLLNWSKMSDQQILDLAERKWSKFINSLEDSNDRI